MTTSLIAPYFTGLAIAAGLIMAIGSQNMFVLRQALKGEHVLPIVAFCILSDALLIWAGVSGLGVVLQSLPGLAVALALGGAAFLTVYGILALRRAFRPSAMILSGDDRLSLGAALATVAAFTFLNPHVYIDTVMLMGAVGASQEPAHRPIFVMGAATASFLWFTALGFGGRFLAPIFARPVAWRILDIVIAFVMFALALGLVREAVSA